MSFTAVHIPEFPVAACLSKAPQLRDRPLVLLRGTPPQESVASVNSVALESGISHGMSKVQAETACRAHFRQRDESEEVEAFRLVEQTVERFSPHVQAIASPANDYAGEGRFAASLLLDCSGTGLLFGTAQSYAERLRRELDRVGFPGSVATASNAEAALILSRSNRGVICVEQSQLQAKLVSLPTSLLPCDAKTHAILQRWGIRTLGQLASLPTTGLISRLGQNGHRLQQLARGEAPHLLAPAGVAFTLSESLELDFPLDDLERLSVALGRLLEAILHKAVEHAYAVRTLTVTLALDRAQAHVVRVSPAHPTQSHDALLRLLDLELQAKPPQHEVLAIRLDADAAQPMRAQRGLFQSQFPESDRLDLLVARLRSIAGERNVGSPELANSQRDDAFTMTPFRPEPTPYDDETRPVRPALRLFRPSQSVRVSLANDRPQTVFWSGTKLLIADAAGPWHMSGLWWDRTTFDCDYWDVQTAQPSYMMRLQRDHATHSWQLVGLYD